MNIGFIGLGIMGSPMCRNLMEKNRKDSFFIYSGKEKTQEFFRRLGAEVCADAAELGGKARMIFSMVPEGRDVRRIYKELFPVLRDDHILIDMSSIDPDTTRELGAEAARRGAHMLDCPVVKSKAAAENATLGIYCGGDKGVYEKIRPYLLCMGSETVYMGAGGSGVTMKAIHNMLVGQIQNGVHEMLALSRSRGIDFDDFIRAVRCGGAGNTYLEAKAHALKTEDFSTAFSVRNMHKDARIARGMAAAAGLSFPGIETVIGVYEEAVKMNLSEQDFSAVYKAVEKRSLRG